MKGLNPTFCLGGDVSFEEFQDDRHGAWPSWISGRNDFSNPDPPCCPVPPMKFRLNPFLFCFFVFCFLLFFFSVREMSFEEFQDGRHSSHL